MSHGRCYCPSDDCPLHEAEISAAEDYRDNPPDDYAADFIDNLYESKAYPNLWN